MIMLNKRRRTSLSVAIGLFAITLTGSTWSTEGGLIDLYKKVEQQVNQEASYNSEREKRFRASASEQANMLADVQKQITAQEQLKTQLKGRFDTNEDKLAELTTALDRRVGDLGELFGVFRQTADDTQTLLFDSLISVEYPQRIKEIEKLAESTEVPTIPQMQSLWRLLMQEVAYSGQLSKFEADIIEPGGTQYTASVTRVGMFNVISDDKYLSYPPGGDALVELPRQPVSYARTSAERLNNAAPNETVAFSLDPSRGALLGLLVQSPSLMERIQQGREVGYLIIALAVFGLLLVAERWMRLSSINRRINKQLKNLDSISDDNPLGRVMSAYYENEHLDDLEVISRKLEGVVISDVADVRKGLPVIKVLAAVAPLMGLLGTVTGMIDTFQAITLFGTGDPKLMAGGISTALITTVLGLVAAIPLLLAHSFLSSRSTYLSKLIGEQAAGLMAQKAEQIAQSKLKAA